MKTHGEERHEKIRKDTKRHEHYIIKCEKTGYILTQFVTAAIKNQLEEKINQN